MKIVNLHTHNVLVDTQLGFVNHSCIENLVIKKEQIYSVGLHPLDILNANENWVQILEKQLQNNEVMAIGECGIDRRINIQVPTQINYFEKQIKLAKEYSLPLIIHSVRSYSDLLLLHKKNKPSNPWILHAYTGNLETTKQLIKHNFYFSIGEQLIRSKKDWSKILNLIPHNRLFFETDAANINIMLIYKRASELLSLSFNDLVENVHHNFQNLTR